MKHIIDWGAACIVTGSALVACGDPLVDPQTVVGLRVLAARTGATDEPSRAHVEPGEAAQVEWLVVAEKTRSFNGLGLWCKASSSTFGTPPCEDPFHRVEFEGSTDSPVNLSFTLPDDLDGNGAWVHWIGVCESGTPKWRADAQRFECSKGSAVSAVYRGNVSAENDNPNLADDELSFDGKAWPASEITDAAPACGDASVPDLDVTKTATIRLQAKGGDRQALDSDDYAAATRESLTYTHVTTWPSLQRPYSAIEADSTETQFEVTFTSDKPPESNGQLVRFALVVRDGRGGTDWLERWFCSRP